MRLSKEFIEAMNGVLNGEKWKRKSWQCHIRFDGSFLCYFNGEEPMSMYRYNKNEMQATDWVKVEEK